MGKTLALTILLVGGVALTSGGGRYFLIKAGLLEAAPTNNVLLAGAVVTVAALLGACLGLLLGFLKARGR